MIKRYPERYRGDPSSGSKSAVYRTQITCQNFDMRKLTATLCLTIVTLLTSATAETANAEDKFYALTVNEEYSSWNAVLSVKDKIVELTIGILECPLCRGLTPNYVQCDKTEINSKGEFSTWCNGGGFATRKISGNLKRANLWDSGNAGGAVFDFIPYSQKKAFETSRQKTQITSTSAFAKALANRQKVKLDRQRKEEKKKQSKPKQIAEKKPTPAVISPVIAQKPSEPSSRVKKELEQLRRENARLRKQNQSKPKQVAKRTPPKSSLPPKSSTSGSGFFVSKSGHVITNQHVVGDCKRVSVGDSVKKQVTADVLETDRRNDLALLKISSLKMASVETKSLIQKLGIKIVPLASDGLLRSEDVDLGEKVLVAGYPYGEMFSNSIKVTGGMVSANRGLGNDTGQFQMDAAVQPGNSGGPIYDENGNIVGVVVAQLNKMKFAKQSGSMPENVNFGIKASTVKQFLSSSGLPTKWSEHSKRMSTRDLAKIAQKQTVMVVCHR